MSVYVISDIKVHDWDGYREYVRRTRPIVESHGGRYHIRGGEVDVRVGDWKPDRLIVIEFPSREHLEKFGTSAEYQPVAAIRESASKSTSVVVVEGYDGQTDNVPSS